MNSSGPCKGLIVGLCGHGNKCVYNTDNFTNVGRGILLRRVGIIVLPVR